MIAGRERVLHRLGKESVVSKPARRAPVELLREARLGPDQAGEQQFPEQVVITIPLLRIVERREKEVPVLQFLQHVLAWTAIDAVVSEQGIYQRGAEPLCDRGAKEEALHVRRLAAEHLVRQVIEYEVLPAREAGNQAFTAWRNRDRAAKALPAAARRPSLRRAR